MEPSSPDKQKACRCCYEQIDARARKCPHCHSIQSLRAIIFAVTAAGVFLIGLLVITVIGSVWLDYRLKNPLDFDSKNYADQIELLESRLLLTNERDKRLTVIGRLRNSASVMVESIQLEVQVINADDELIESLEGSVGAISAQSDKSFKISDWRTTPLESLDGVTHRVIIHRASHRIVDKPK